jgi:dTDP-4-dehydrorhamnose reductase
LSLSRKDIRWCFRTRTEWDILDRGQGEDILIAERPDWIINAAAYTAVDRAETETDVAWKVNARGPALLADLCQKSGVRMLHLSTDYVFGQQGEEPRPWREEDLPCPLNAYGRSKLAGEEALAARGGRAWVLRVGWLFSGEENSFLGKIVQQVRQGRPLKVVDDQIGTPTNVDQLAALILALIQAISSGQHLPNLLHVSGGEAVTWRDFAKEALATLAPEIGMHMPEIVAISTDELDLPARRPAWSVLDDRRLRDAVPELPQLDWRDGLADVMRAAWHQGATTPGR